MSSTNYDGQIHRDYAVGRALHADQFQVWMQTLAKSLPRRRPLNGLDLGSGTGRFSPHLADAFGPVVGVEPSTGMRSVACTESTHDDVRYLAGSAENIPADDESFDYCLMFLAWHHVTEPDRAAQEVARVLRPGGVLLCRTQFADLMPNLWWLRHFPNGWEADAAMYRTLEEDLACFSSAGLEPAPGLVWVDEPSLGTKKERLDQVRTRTLSVLHRMSDEDFTAGVASLEQEVARDPDQPAPTHPVTLLVVTKPT